MVYSLYIKLKQYPGRIRNDFTPQWDEPLKIPARILASLICGVFFIQRFSSPVVSPPNKNNLSRKPEISKIWDRGLV